MIIVKRIILSLLVAGLSGCYALSMVPHPMHIGVRGMTEENMALLWDPGISAEQIDDKNVNHDPGSWRPPIEAIYLKPGKHKIEHWIYMGTKYYAGYSEDTYIQTAWNMNMEAGKTYYCDSTFSLTKPIEVACFEAPEGFKYPQSTEAIDSDASEKDNRLQKEAVEYIKANGKPVNVEIVSAERGEG